MSKQSIFAGFEEYQIPTEASIHQAIRTGIVVIDTNILLNLYKMDEAASDIWLKVLTRLGDRLWVPHQVMLEFWSMRSTVAVHPQAANQTLNKLNTAAKSVEVEYQAWQSSRGGTEQGSSLLEAALNSIDQLRSEIAEFIDERKNRFSSDPEQDTLVQNLAVMLGNRIGQPFSVGELEKLHKDADQRFAVKTPPGYMDDGSNPDTKVGKDTDKKYGDFILWQQTLNYAKSRFSDEAQTGQLLLITADGKEDWWRKETTGGDSPTHRARYELIVEARTVAGASLIMQKPIDFLKDAARTFGINLSQGIIDSTTAASKGVETETPEQEVPTVPEELAAWLGGAIVARGRDHEEGFLVESGWTRAETTDTTPAGTVRLRNRLLEEGVFEVVDDTTWKLAVPHLFSSASAAANVMLARNSNGLIEWKNETGDTLKQLQQQYMNRQS